MTIHAVISEIRVEDSRATGEASAEGDAARSANPPAAALIPNTNARRDNLPLSNVMACSGRHSAEPPPV
jgi:hypothetical protein